MKKDDMITVERLIGDLSNIYNIIETTGEVQYGRWNGRSFDGDVRFWNSSRHTPQTASELAYSTLRNLRKTLMEQFLWDGSDDKRILGVEYINRKETTDG
jgi:hypothetical protein|tara:strand:+ start:3434 stop:3733 length:300 start_codon:yes stop_codon:yes gene_type:complete